MRQMIASNGQELTMTSKEMADLTEKRHDSVKRTIDTLAERGTIQLPQIVEVTNHLGQSVTEYRIGKRDSYVIVAQLSPEFTARLVDRWQELEGKQVQPVALTRMEILRIAMESEEARIKAESERDYAIATKAQIGSKREATAMATASAAKREVARLKDELGVNQRHATIVAVEKALDVKFDGQFWRNLKRWCDNHGITATKVTDPRWGEVRAWPAEAWKEVQGVDLASIFPAPPGMAS